MSKKGLCKKDTITIMCDYSAYGLWFNGYAINAEYKKLPKIINLMVYRIEKWQLEYEMQPFLDTQKEVDRYQKSKRFKNWNKEGLEIAKKIKRIVKNKYKVVFFDESNSKRIEIKQ